jgi:hypothetical protein
MFMKRFATENHWKRILQVGHIPSPLITAANIDSQLLQFIFNHKKSSYH